MANQIAIIELTPGEVAFYDEKTGMFLNMRNKQSAIYDTDDISGILSGIRNHVIRVAQGTLEVREPQRMVPSVPSTPEITAPPVFYGVEDTIVFINQYFNNMLGVTAMDNEGMNITKDVDVKGLVDVNTPGEYVLVYTVSDKAGNVAKAERTITVRDNIAPVFTGVEDKTINPGEDFDPRAGVEAHDNVDGNVTENIHIEKKAEEPQPQA